MPSPVRAQAYDCSLSLIDSANRPYFRLNPTLEAGDFQVSKDEGPLANLASLPTVTPAGSVLVHLSLSAAEMDADNVVVVCRDASGAQWDDLLLEISTEPTAATITPTPASGATVWSALDLIKASLRKIGVLGAGETPEAASAQDALGEMNRLLEILNVQPSMTYTTAVFSKALSAGQIAVTIGPGGDINTARPIRLTSGYVRVGSVDAPLTFLGQAEYDGLAYKTTLGTTWPSFALYEPDFPLGTVRLFPPPLGGATLFLSLDVPLEGFATTAQAVSLPPGYADVLIYGLAKRLAPEYGRQLDALFLSEYREIMKLVRRQNAQPQTMDIDGALLRRGADAQWIVHGGGQ